MKFILSSILVILFSATYSIAQSTRSQTQSSGGSSSGVRSGVLFDVGTYYGTEITETRSTLTSESKVNESVFDMKLGYVFNYGLYAGAAYSVRNRSELSFSTTGNATGLGLGYFFRNGLYLRAYYRFNEVYSDFRNGTGYQIDASYSQMFATNFYLGFALSRRDINFTKRDSDVNIKNYNYSSTYPMLTLGFLIN